MTFGRTFMSDIDWIILDLKVVNMACFMFDYHAYGFVWWYFCPIILQCLPSFVSPQLGLRFFMEIQQIRWISKFGFACIFNYSPAHLIVIFS